MPLITNLDKVREGDTGRIFEGFEYGDVNISFFYTDAEPGTGPVLHTHPYEEVFVIMKGEATFTLGDQSQVGKDGDILHAPPNTPHKWVNSGEKQLSMINIHPSERIIQEDLE